MERHGAALEILFEDRELLVCRKPAGLPVQSASFGTKDMVSMLRTYLAEKGAKGGVPYVGVVHRLDQPVEGVIVFAKNQKSAAGLSAQAADGRMEKVYQAVVLGNPGPEGHLTDWLLKDGRTNTYRVVEPGTKGAKKAELSYRTLAEKDGKTLVEIRLHTGRHHQIRVQFAKMGTPLWGDRKYGPAAPAAAPSGETERPQASVEATVPSGEAERPQASVEVTAPSGNTGRPQMPAPAADSAVRPRTVALCAVRLTFAHPSNGKKMTFSCAPRGDGFQDFLQGDAFQDFQ